MKRILILLILSANFAFAQNFNWITPNKTYLKMYVSDDGIYRINKSDFTNAGINANGIDPRTVKVLYKGAQIPIYFFGEQDGVFNDNDYFDFYGKRNYGDTTVTYKATMDTVNVVDYVTNEYYSLYSDTSVYWVDWGGAYGLRFADYGFTSSVPYPNQYYNIKRQFEKDSLYWLGERRSNDDYRDFNTEKISSEGWFWKQLNPPQNASLTAVFDLSNLYTTPQNCLFKLFAYPNSYLDTVYNEHSLIIKINGTNIDTLFTNDYNRIDTSISFSSALLLPGQNQVTVTYKGAGGYYGYMYFDFFNIQYPARFEFQDNSISYAASFADTSANIYKIKGYVSSNEVNIYDIKNNVRITASSGNADTLIFSGKRNGKFEVINKYITKKPFRIKQKQVPNLVTITGGADYLIVYNKILESSAELLRQYRSSHDTLRSFKAEIEDIYDVFNFGMESPVAVRYFTKNAYENWQQPRFRYLCLLGRGSLDPKGNFPASVYTRNLVPVYGNPPSDGYFANFNLNSSTYYHQVAVGRIPALTEQEATNIINKTIAYENQSSNPENFFKNFIFITGGQDRQEQITFAAQSEIFVNNYILPQSVSGYPVRIYRNDSSGGVTYNYSDSIKNALNRGGLITNYIGHAGSTVWDNGLTDPGVLANQNRLSLILSMTCFTGKNSESETRSFGENFINLTNKGAVGFIGTTGWSFSGSGNTLNEYLIREFARDTIRRIGDIMRLASGRLYSDPVSFASRNTINCYSLLGDPAATLLMPKYPEFAIDQSNYKLSNPFPSVREPIVLTIYPRNLGIYSDSVKIRFTLIKNNVNNKQKDTVVHGFGFIDTIGYLFSLDSAGNYSMKIDLDPDRWNTKEIKTNNSITFSINLKNSSFLPLKPVNDELVSGDTVTVTGINPNVSPGNNVRLLFQADTSSSFNSPLSRTYFIANPQGVVTKFGYSVPLKDSSTVYFWRMNSIINNTDTSGWSDTRRFIYGNSVFSKINTLDPKNKLALADRVVTIYKKKISQYSLTDLMHASGGNDSIVVSKFTGSITAQSWGNNLFNMTRFVINNNEYQLSDTGSWGGLNIIKINKTNARFIEKMHFAFTTSQSNDSAINFLNTFTDNNILIILKTSPYNTNFNINSSLRSRIRVLGSAYIDSVNVQSFSCWSFINYSTIPNIIDAESYNTNFNPAICSMQPVFYYDSAYVYSNFGPARTWSNFKWSNIIPVNTRLAFDVYGVNQSSQNILLLSNLTGNSGVPLDSFNAYTYPSMRLVAKLYMDSLNGFVSPVLNNLKFNYTPAAEIIADNNSVVKSDSIMQEGDTLGISVRFGNFGYANATSYINKWSASSPSGIKILKVDTVYNTLYVDSMGFSSVRLSTVGLRDRNKRFDTVTVYFETSLIRQNEFYTYNNVAVTRIVLTGDTLKPEMEITYDGVRGMSGDFIAAKPHIVLKFLDDSKIFIKDTSNIRVRLDDSTVWYYINGVKNPVIDLVFPAGKSLQATLYYNPSLSDGDHTFQFTSIDANGNYSDTVTHLMTVNPELKIADLKNYPNPMKSETYFLINLSGGTPPSGAKLKIFTVAGRVIKTINANLSIGYNQIYWDGKDADGDYIANGVYFYKLIIDGNNKKETALQKLVVLK